VRYGSPAYSKLSFGSQLHISCNLSATLAHCIYAQAVNYSYDNLTATIRRAFEFCPNWENVSTTRDKTTSKNITEMNPDSISIARNPYIKQF
jgi:hypothetical protein